MKLEFAAVLIAVLSASAQTSSSHSGWNFTDTLQGATDVLVGDLTGGTAVDGVSQVTVKATLRVARTLKGGIAPGMDVALQWQYAPGPMEGPAVTTKVPQTRGLWFLRRNSHGTLEPLRAGSMTPMGGSFLPLGSGIPSGPLAYAESDPLPRKIACEIGTAIADPAVQRRDRITVRSLTMVLESLDKAAVSGVYQYFSTLPEPNFKAIGILGRLAGGDTSAVFDLEKNMPGVASAFDGSPAPHIVGLDLSKDSGAAHALARVALGNTPIPGLEGTLAFNLARTRSPEMLPYLIVMLGSPDPGVRGSALMAFCQLLGPMPAPTALWSSEMAGYCPNGSPMNDRDLEQKDTQFWKQWWDAHRGEIGKTVALPTVMAPARYSTLPNNGSQSAAEVPMEVRFETLLHMTAAMQPQHYHTGDGTVAEGPPPTAHDPVGGQLSPADREVFRLVTEAAAAKLAAVQARAQQMMNVARIAGTPPDLQQSKALNADRQAALKAGLDDLRARLSPEGWQAVERFLQGMGIRMVPLAPPK